MCKYLSNELKCIEVYVYCTTIVYPLSILSLLKRKSEAKGSRRRKGKETSVHDEKVRRRKEEGKEAGRGMIGSW